MTENEAVIEEEYETWKNNRSLMYDSMPYERSIPDGCLTFQWFPDAKTGEDKIRTQHILLGSYVIDDDDDNVDSIRIGEVTFRESGNDITNGKTKKESSGRVKIAQKFNHKGEVNKARFMPKSPWLIATSGGEGAYYLYDTTESPSDYRPVLLNHHKKEGFGLSWNNAGQLATGATDSTCAIWDIDQGAKNKEGYKPVTIYRNRSRLGDMESYVNDVKWSSHSEPLFGTATEDGKLCIYDARQKNVQQEIVAHYEPVNGMCFSAHCPNLVATASADETVGLWDMRNLKVRLHSLMGHSDAVLSIEWSPHHDSVLASSGKDRRIIMWDISKIGEEQQPEDAEDGAPELLFMHGGHQAAIEDFGWNPVREWCIGSVSADAKMQVWRPKDSIVNSKPLQVKDSDLE